MAKSPGNDPLANFFAKASEAMAEVTHGAVADIRTKLIDEAWFGRPADTASERSMAEQLGWAKPGESTEVRAWNGLTDQLAKERASRAEQAPDHDHDHGHER